MCLGAWSKMGYIENRDIRAVMSIEPEIEDTGVGSDFDW